MNKRTQLKKRNLELFIKKNILNSKFIVRNLIVATVVVSAVAGAVGVATVAGDSISKRKQSANEAVATEYTETATMDTYSIESTAVERLEASTTNKVLSGFEDGRVADIQINNAEIVAYYMDEFDRRIVCTEDDVNIREQSDENSEVVGTLNKGCVGDILSADGDWIKVSSGSVTGYVHKEFVVTGDEAAEFVIPYMSTIAVVNDSGVYVRKEASKESEYVGVANVGDAYTADITRSTQDWIFVKTDAFEGYIYGEFVELSQNYHYAVSAKKLPEANGSITPVEPEDKPEKPQNTEEPTTEAPSTEAPATEEPSTEAPATEEPTTEEAASDETSDRELPATMVVGEAVSLSEEDIYLCACVLTLECGGESYEGQVAVANVILNRYKSGIWGSTITDVLYAKNQFSVVYTERFQNIYNNGGAQESCIQAVRDACAGYNNIYNFMSYRAMYAAKISTYSAYTIIGNHVFF